MQHQAKAGQSPQSWRNVLARFGDPLYKLALLFTNHRATAEDVLVSAVCQLYSARADDSTEIELYVALLNQCTNYQRYSKHRRRAQVVPSQLVRVAPTDRYLLGLWLLRDLHGAQLATVMGQTPVEVVARLASLLSVHGASAASNDAENEHITLANWLEQQLGLNLPTSHQRVCPICHTRELQWRVDRDAVRLLLTDALAHERLPTSCLSKIEARLTITTSGVVPSWWRQPRWWVAMLVIAGFVMLTRWVSLSPTTSEPAPNRVLNPRELVAATIDTWTTPPATGTLKRRVRAINPHHPTTEPLVIDVWQTAEKPAQHRIEVRQNQKLVAWQLGDDTDQLVYASQPAYSICRWILNGTDLLTPAALSFRLAADQQRQMRDAALTENAYGIGYKALEEALAASDLRSFGTRRNDKQTLALLMYTRLHNNVTEQIMLQIDPQTNQLHSVQSLGSVASPGKTRELWQLQQRETNAQPMPLSPPAWDRTETRSALIDARCPELKPERVLSLRALLGPTGHQWYLPNQWPAGIEQAVLTTDIWAELRVSEPVPTSVLFIGPERSLQLSAANWRPNVSTSRDVQRGAWRIQLRTATTSPATWRGTLRRAQSSLAPAFVPTIDVYAQGWTEAELLALTDTLAEVNISTWQTLHQQFLDPQPLPAAAQTLVAHALKALQPPPDQLLSSTANIELRRVPPQPEPTDPYHLPVAIRQPARLLRQQQLLYGAEHSIRYADRYMLPDATLYKALLNDGFEVTFAYPATGWIGSSPANEQDTPAPKQIGVEMLEFVLDGTGSIRSDKQAEGWLLEQTSVFDSQQIAYDFWGSELPVPWLEDLGAGDIVRRLWLDHATYLPRRLELVHRNTQAHETVLYTSTLTSRNSSRAQLTADALALPMLPQDGLIFNSIAASWRQAQSTFPPISTHWRMASFDPSGETVQLSRPDQRTPLQRILRWEDASGHIVRWQLRPAVSPAALNIGTLRANTWHDLSRLTTAYRTEYAMAPDGATITLTQGPAWLVRNILRFPPARARGVTTSGGWTESRSLPVTIDGQTYTAWLLQNDEIGALVIETPDVMLHITGRTSYLAGPLLDELPKLVWQVPEP